MEGKKEKALFAITGGRTKAGKEEAESGSIFFDA